ncbi:hydroxymethylglutaryl-CoA reductase, degradative [Fructilactobacillus sanfranciscensis]|uniref:hydroxymethylglutaryl-CoA reductase, degradative n=1 Tax=Fructilactobacillus sanfranciscensis TaxID=1625 RepID=UPI0037568600
MTDFSGFFRKPYQERLKLVAESANLNEDQIKTINQNFQSVGSELIENYLTDFGLPEGIATNFRVNDKDYLIPMVTEEPSVIAAASNGAKMLLDGGGITATAASRVLTGEIILKTDNVLGVQDWFEKNKDKLIEIALKAHPSITQYGGIRDIKYNMIDEEHVSFELFVNVGDAMGANTMNSMLEAAAKNIEISLGQEVLMSILSNYGDYNIVIAKGKVPFDALQRGDLSGEAVARKIEEAAHVANIYPKRAATHNKGIMNGIDAVVIATGNDWRAVEAATHSYAARKGSYKGLSKWRVTEDGLEGMIKLPIPTGTVGGATHLLPMSKINYQILDIDNAIEIMEVLAGVGLAQNLAALKALVTDGIQRGHMRLQLKSLAMTAGAKGDEIKEVSVRLADLPDTAKNLENATRILKELKGEK